MRGHRQTQREWLLGNQHWHFSWSIPSNSIFARDSSSNIERYHTSIGKRYLTCRIGPHRLCCSLLAYKYHFENRNSCCSKVNHSISLYRCCDCRHLDRSPSTCEFLFRFLLCFFLLSSSNHTHKHTPSIEWKYDDYSQLRTDFMHARMDVCGSRRSMLELCERNW